MAEDAVVRGRTVKSPERVAEAQRMRAEGYSLKVIAQCFGIGVSTAHAWIIDPDLSKQKALRDTYRGRCVDCGKPTDGSFGPGKAPERCNPCSIRRIAATGNRSDMAIVRERAERIVAWWHEGRTCAQIAAELGWSKAHVGQELGRLRAKGYDLPHRRTPEQVERIRAGWARARKAAA